MMILSRETVERGFFQLQGSILMNTDDVAYVSNMITFIQQLI